MTHDKCKTILEDKKTHCNEPVFGSLRIRLLWYDTGHISIRTTYACKKHFLDMINSKGQGWEILDRKLQNTVAKWLEIIETN